MYFKLAAHDDMERQLVASNEKCEEAEATIKQLMLDIAELRQTSSRFESELAQERVDHQLERSQDAHLIKELRKVLHIVRDIACGSLASMCGDPPSHGDSPALRCKEARSR